MPDDALLYHQGRALVYIRVPNQTRQFERREVRVLGRQGDRWLVAKHNSLDPSIVGVNEGDQVVYSGAQSLLSLEFRRDADDD
jgi:hypothetical protein